MKILVLTLATCFLNSLAEDTLENDSVRVAFKIYEDCSATDAFSSCLKKKAITFLDRLGRMETFSLADGITLTRTTDIQDDININEEHQLHRSANIKDEVLNAIFLDKISKFMESRTIEITMPKFSADDFEEGRKGGGGGGGGGGGKGGMKGMMGGLMMGMAAKMAAMIPVAIAGLFLLAGKALITAKIALLLSGIIAIKKLFGSKHGGSSGGSHGGGGGGGWQSSGHGGGWQSSGGGWDKRSIENPQHLAYSAYTPK